jgi:hypothetical protein
MTNDEFISALKTELEAFEKAVSNDEKDWIIKGFIDIYKNIYGISIDTKIVSKVLELLLFPLMVKFADKNKLTTELSPQQNFYPDITFIDDKANKFALDIKTTYRVDNKKVNGMTLGAFTGYFRKRDSAKNIKYPYQDYSGHFILGIIYSQCSDVGDERKKFSLDELQKIPSVIKDFKFFAQPKFRLATDRPGSGNTKNIGSVIKIDDLINGTGPFNELGEEIFDDYWIYYLTKDMAKALEISRPYTNLKTYQAYKVKGNDILKLNKEKIENMEEEDEPESENGDSE